MSEVGYSPSAPPVRFMFQLWGDLKHDDTDAVNAFCAGSPVSDARTGQPVTDLDGEYLVLGPVHLPTDDSIEVSALFLGPEGRAPRIIDHGCDPFF